MATSLEKLRKIIKEEEAALLIKKLQHQQLTTMEQEAFKRLKDKLSDDAGMDELPPIEQLQKLYKKPNPLFEVQSAHNETIAKIFANFKEEFGEENIHGNCLHFPDDEDNSKADAFFSQQANEGHAFLFKEVNSDNYAFSDGKGHYKMGCKADIISYCKKNSLELPDYFNTKVSDEQEHTPSILSQ
ncbi:TPA: hypothetical protein ACU9KK_002636 [Legionella anisa]